ncbi:hypothetical protein BGX24_011313 [Mortierella sp. AD032]|nr:hypothetical protein BGX24_011313 [Mortierella sp. AD032]
MTRSPENDAMAIDLTHSRDQSPASEATFRTLTLQSPTLCQQNEWQYPPRTITSSGNKDLPPLLQPRLLNYNDKENERVSQPALKRKNQEEDLPRKRDSLLTLQSSSPATGSHTSTLASLLAALRDDTQAGDSDCQQTHVEHSTVTAVETGVGGEMEKANRSRTHNSGARSRAIDKKKASRNYMLSYFKEWCIRKEYTDGDWVTREKYIAYAKEITAPQSHTDNDIPRLSVKPLFVKSRIGRSAQRASLSTVENYLRAVRVLYKSQCLVDGIIPNVVEGLGKAEIDAIMKDYDKLLKYTTSKRLSKGGKDEGGEEGSEDEGGEDEGDQDDADNSEDEDDASGAYAKELTAREEYYDKDNPHLCVKPFIVNAHKGPDARRASKSTVRAALTAVRALYMDQCTREKVAPNVIVDLAKTAIDTILMDYQNLLKSDPSLPRVVSPDGQDVVNVHKDVERRDIYEDIMDSPNQAFFTRELVDVCAAGSIAPGVCDSERYSIFLREDDVHICPVGALAFFLLAKWMDKKSYPNFDNDNWTTVPVEFLNDALKAGDITRQHEGGSSLISQFAESMYTKVDARPYRAFFDHLTRSPSPVQSKYKKIPPIILSATLSQKAVFGLSRNRILPPPDLQRQLFPFVEDFYDDSKDWKMWVENIMMDRPEDANRLQERERDNEYYRADYPIIRLLLFVAGLRKVILQDFAAMLAGEGSEEGEKRMGYDHIFAIKHPVLSSPAFREFTTHLREAMVADPAEQSKTVAETNQPAEEATVQTLQVQETRSLANRTRSVTVIRQASEEPYLDSFVDGMTNIEIAIVEEQPLSTEESLPIVARTQQQGTETDSLLQTIQELCARVASLEQHEKPGQNTERPTPLSATTTIRNQVSTSAVSQVKNTSIDMDTTMDVDMEIDVAVTADRLAVTADRGAKGNITSNKKDSERLLQENQDLRVKVAALERVNRELAELNQVRQRLSSRTPEPLILSTRAASVPRSRVVSVAHDGHTSGSNMRGGGTAYFSPVSVVQDHHSTLSTITTVANNTISNQSTNSNRSNRSETPTSLRQEVQDLRDQLASLEQEEQQVLDYATVAIESVEFLDNKVNQIEQSMHGLWSMIARNEAAKFAASLNAPASLTAAAAVTSGGPRSPRSPSLGLSSPPPLTGATAPAAFPLQYQHQHQDPLGRLAARLRVDTLPLRSRVASAASAASSTASAADVASSVHGKMRS